MIVRYQDVALGYHALGRKVYGKLAAEQKIIDDQCFY
jgi:hypothetical protein